MPELKKTADRTKVNFGSRRQIMDIYELIKAQTSSYNWFIQPELKHEERKRRGLHEVFLEIFPIKDFSGNLMLEYKGYNLGLPMCKKCPNKQAGKVCRFEDCTYDERECEIAFIGDIPLRIKHSEVESKKKSLTYAVRLELVVELINKSTGEIKRQTLYLCDLPIMTKRGTFIYNGTERVIVSQLHRSPGVYFEYDKAKKSYTSKVIPYRGAWLELELDVIKDLMNVRLDRKRKIPVTTFLKALGYKKDEIIKIFKDNHYINKTFEIDKAEDYKDALKEIFHKLRPGEPFAAENAIQLLRNLFFDRKRYDFSYVGRYKLNRKIRLRDRIIKKYLAEDIKDSKGKIVARKGDHINLRTAHKLEEMELETIKIKNNEGDVISTIIEKDAETIFLNDYMTFAEDIKIGSDKVLFKKGAKITDAAIEALEEHKIQKVDIMRKNVIYPDKSIVELRHYNGEIEQNVIEHSIEVEKYILGRHLTKTHMFEYEGEKIKITPEQEITIGLVEVIINSGLDKIEVTKGRVLAESDIIAMIRYMIDLSSGIGHLDDIDHLGNRRVRRCGEMLQNQFRISLTKMEREIKEKMTLQDNQGVTAQNFINNRPIKSMLDDFFGTSQLSQFMDQTNPIAELTHKRRISALGPGGVKRERAGYEVRDVHPTHFGKLCPIETPEGPNAGLISSLAVYTRINKYGFLETPYREIVDDKVTENILYMDAYEEDDFIIVPPDVDINRNNKFENNLVPVKYLSDIGHEFSLMESDKVDFCMLSSMQMISVAASLIPFLEHDDANRALMGTNMQRQAVPLLNTELPYVGTGIEKRVAVDSGTGIVANHDCVVEQVAADYVKVRRLDKTEDINLSDTTARKVIRNRKAAEDIKKGKKVIVKKEELITPGIADKLYKNNIESVKLYLYHKYLLNKFQRSNQSTCINQRPIVKEGDILKTGQPIADGAATAFSEVALGRNITVAFMSWEGYNFEDAIILSQRLVKDDSYTSMHVEEYEIETRDTKLGAEEITRDIPNVSQDLLSNLDDDGIIRVGAEVEAGDILVGKITPKGETDLTVEDKLLRAIFGEKARDVRNTSYTVPHGETGTVIGVNVFSRENNDELPHDINKLVRIYIAQKRKILVGDKMAGRHGNKGVIANILPEADMPYFQDGTPVDIILNPLGVPSRMNLGQVYEGYLGYVGYVFDTYCETPVFDAIEEKELFKYLVLANLVRNIEIPVYNKEGVKIARLAIDMVTDEERKMLFENAVENGPKSSIAHLILKKNSRIIDKDENVMIATLSSKSEKTILKALESGDLTSIYKKAKGASYLEHNLEPVFEIQRKGKKITEKALKKYSPEILEIENLDKIYNALKEADIFTYETGKQYVSDGRSGRKFENPVMIGNIYMLKLAHLVDDKIHARATGPYSLVTQQPLGGKAQFGGQRFGEMEVWALEAYGAAHILQELLTVKSDDVEGRVQVYETIIKGGNAIKASVPESFKVLVSELQSLCLKVELIKEEDSTEKTSEKEGAETASESKTIA
ncbi:MAG: DNA-directed RNA polymerase subunit beta [Candidatus Muiribacteriota bacterium]